MRTYTYTCFLTMLAYYQQHQAQDLACTTLFCHMSIREQSAHCASGGVPFPRVAG